MAKVEKDLEGFRLFRAIGAFLEEHRLAPTPGNYSLVYLVLTKGNDMAVEEVANATGDGLRLRQADADRIIELIGKADPVRRLDDGVLALRAQIDDLGRIIDRARSEMESYGRELDGQAREATASAPFAGIIASMCDRTSAAHQALADAAADVRNMRQTLAKGGSAVLLAQTDGFGSIVDRIGAEASRYGRDLESIAGTLAAAGVGNIIAEIVRSATVMVERTNAAEKALQESKSEIVALRQKLTAARKEARCDILTGLLNRRGFEAEYDSHVDGGAALTVALCDLDRFKRINDDHGHAVGDRVLKLVAQMLKRECGSHPVARYGGEEFAILFVGISLEAACRIVEGALDVVGGREVRVRETDRPIGKLSFSAGVVAAAPGESHSSLLRRADALLYHAKASGRSRIERERSGNSRQLRASHTIVTAHAAA